MIDLIYEPWPWYLSGALLALIMATLLFFGESFGFSSNLRTLCTLCGADKAAPFFSFDWRTQAWNLVFLIGTGLGGYLAHNYMTAEDYQVEISESTIQDLEELGFSYDQAFAPLENFSWEATGDTKNLIILIVGGFLVGFGTRYAGGCTSGHAISGLSNLQPASLLAVVGFFIGGLLMTHVLFPLIY